LNKALADALQEARAEISSLNKALADALAHVRPVICSNHSDIESSQVALRGSQTPQAEGRVQRGVPTHRALSLSSQPASGQAVTTANATATACDCSCWWTHGGTTCGYDDGTSCWRCCCGQ
jgi:hypothetical protein